MSHSTISTEVVAAAATAAAASSALPYHVLMVPSHDQTLQRRQLLEQRLAKDYISRRFNSLEDNSKQQASSKNKKNTASTQQQHQQQPPTAATIDVWRGTSPLERCLVECCEIPATWEEAATGGAVAKGNEIRFLGLLASCCHDAGSRALALAILERTIQKDEKELETEQQSRHEADDDDNDNDEEEDEEDEENDEKEIESEDNEEDESNDLESATSKGEKDGVASDEIGQNEKGGKNDVTDKENSDTALLAEEAKSRQEEEKESDKTTGLDTPESAAAAVGENAKLSDNDEQSTNAAEFQDKALHGSEAERSPVESDEDKKQEKAKRSTRGIAKQMEGRRMDVFLGAGGLSLLNQWFKEAISPIVSVKLPPSSSSQSGFGKKPPQQPSPSTATTRPSPTGPILLPLLSVLEKIPFDKKLVMETKINKQIRKLSKHVDALMKPTAPSADVTDPVSGGLSVVAVKKAVDALKQTWEEQASGKNAATSLPDPFAELKKKMAERLATLNRFEAGETPKPEWLSRFDHNNNNNNSNNNDSKKRKATTTMTELQARERQEERNTLTRKLNEARHARVKVLNKIRQLRMADVSHHQVEERKSTKAKKVTWKDGLTLSESMKVRTLLEQVRHYDPYEFGEEEEEEDDTHNLANSVAGITPYTSEDEEHASDAQTDVDESSSAPEHDDDDDPLEEEESMFDD